MENDPSIHKLQFSTSIGTFAIYWQNESAGCEKISRIDWLYGAHAPECSAAHLPRSIWLLSEQLRGYSVSGEPMGAVDWELLDSSGWTPFQKAVYEAIAGIPFGETRSYAWVAQKIGNINASRAVGQALRKNPIPILIPCHRVTAVNSLGGFMGYIDPHEPATLLKQKLIELEEKYLNPEFSFLTATA